MVCETHQKRMSLLQDIFVLIHRLCNTFDSSRGSARFWILQMTYRRAISRRRYLTSRHFYTRLDLDEAAETHGHAFVAPGPLQSSIDEICGNEGLEKILESLSDKQRQALRLFFVEVLHLMRSPRNSAKPPAMSAIITTGDWRNCGNGSLQANLPSKETV